MLFPDVDAAVKASEDLARIRDASENAWSHAEYILENQRRTNALLTSIADMLKYITYMVMAILIATLFA